MIRPCLEAGGATRTILNLADGLCEQGHRISLAAGGGEWPARARQPHLSGYTFALSPSTPLRLLLAARQLRTLLRQQAVDLIHAHHRFAGLVARMATVGTVMPLVTTVHEFSYDHRWLTRLTAGQQTITFSSALRRHLVDHYHLSPATITVVPPGILPAPARSGSSRSSPRPVIGCIARLSREKGIDILLQALAHLYQTTEHRPQCMIAGDGPLLTALKEQAMSLQIDNAIAFLGWQDDIIAFIEQVDFLVLPSRSEGFGLAILEGWRQGRPTIGSQIGGIAELIQDGENGLLVPVDDFQALAVAMVRLLESRPLIRWMGHRGRQEKLPAYTMEAMVQQTEQIYLKCIVDNEESARNRS